MQKKVHLPDHVSLSMVLSHQLVHQLQLPSPGFLVELHCRGHVQQRRLADDAEAHLRGADWCAQECCDVLKAPLTVMERGQQTSPAYSFVPFRPCMQVPHVISHVRYEVCNLGFARAIPGQGLD